MKDRKMVIGYFLITRLPNYHFSSLTSAELNVKLRGDKNKNEVIKNVFEEIGTLGANFSYTFTFFQHRAGY